MNRIIFLFIFLFVAALDVSAQDSASVANDVTILYRKESSGGITIHGNGLGVIFRTGRHVTIRKKRMFEAEFVSMRHPKQYKVTNDYVPADSKPFFFGKLNFLFIPRVGVGKQHVIFGKADRSGVEVRYNYFGGVDLAFTKPVYLEVLENDPFNADVPTIVIKKYNPDDPEQQDVTSFLGPASFFMGFDQMKFYPGLYGKFSVSFEYSTLHEKIAILETGMCVDVFEKAIPIMALTKNSQYYFNFYISLMWGAKKN